MNLKLKKWKKKKMKKKKDIDNQGTKSEKKKNQKDTHKKKLQKRRLVKNVKLAPNVVKVVVKVNFVPRLVVVKNQKKYLKE